VATSTITGIGEVERKALVGTGLRAALSAGILLAVYFLMPIDIRHNNHGLLHSVGVMSRLGVAVAIFVAVLTFEIRGITRARHPMLRAGVAMAIVIPLFLVFFAWTYLNMTATDPGTFGLHAGMSRMTALYFTITVFSTVGFGDFTPHTDLARLVTSIQMIADLVVIAVVVRLILGAATRTVGQRTTGDGPADGAASDAS
jgi:ACR3 family arsenite efflux pump ArsB